MCPDICKYVMQKVYFSENRASFQELLYCIQTMISPDEDSLHVLTPLEADAQLTG